MTSPSAIPSVSPMDVASGTEQGSASTSTDKPRLFLEHGDMYMSNDLSVAHRISEMIKTMIDAPYRNWSHTPHDVRDLWFEEFRKLCWWDTSIDPAVRKYLRKLQENV